MIAIVLNRYQNRFFELLPIFFVVLLFSGNSLPAQHLIENPFQWLEAIQSRSLKIQADSLEQTISRNIAPPFFYDLLLQRYLMLDSLDHAEQFFQRRIRQQPDDNFAAQTLANLYQHGHDPQITAQAFRRALDAGQPSWGLVDDIFAFNQRFPEHAISQHIFAPYFSSKTDLLFVRSLAAYHEGNYKTVISNLANVYKNNTLPLELFKRYGHSFEMARQRNRADSLWQELLHSLTNQKNEYQIAAVLEKRATNYLSQNRMEEAVVLYDSALVIAKKLGDFGLQQRILGNKGHALRFMNDLKSAAAFYTQALDIAEKLKEPLYCYFWYQRLGEIRLDESRFDETLRMLDKAQHAAQDAHYFRGMVSILLEFGDTYSYLQLHELAKKAYEASRENANAFGIDSYLPRINGGLGTLAEARGDYESAISAYQSVLDATTSERHRAYWHYLIANIYKRQHQEDLAEEHYRSALKLAESSKYNSYIGWSACGLGETALKKNALDSAYHYFEYANRIADSSHYSLRISALCGIGDALRAQNDLSAAIREYRRAVQIAEKVNRRIKVEELRIGHFDIVSEAYTRLVDSYYLQYLQTGAETDLDSLYFYKEFSLGRSLKYWDVRKTFANRDAAPPDSLHRIYREMCAQLQQKQRRLREKAMQPEHRDGWDDLLAETEIARYSLLGQQLNLMDLVDNSPQLAQNSVSIRNITKLQDRLRELNGAMLLYHISDKTAFAMLLSGSTHQVVPLNATKNDIESAISDLLNPFHGVETGSIQSTPFRAAVAFRLYQMLIEPIEAQIKLPEKLVIVPDLVIANLPFGLLLNQKPPQHTYTPVDFPEYAANFLQHRYSFTYIPSPGFLNRQVFTPPAKPAVLAFADPFNYKILSAQNESRLRQNENWYFPPLPYSQQEVERIKNIYPKTEIFTLDAATKQQFITSAPDYSVLHVASHGFVNPTFEAFSGLVFAFSESDTVDDGLLLGYEISELKLKSDLVTLSACETGEGKRVAGEGVLGMPRLFLNAGANSVLMTLWKVDDYFSAQLMPDFYANFLNKKRTKTDALTLAQRDILNQPTMENGVYYQHPLYWAAFALYGDPGAAAGSGFPVWVAIVAGLVLIVAGWHLFRRKIQ